MCQEEHPGDVCPGGGVGEIDGLRNRGVDVLLEGRLDTDVPFRCYGMGGHKHSFNQIWNIGLFLEVVATHQLAQKVGIPDAGFTSCGFEMRVDVQVPFTIKHVADESY